MRAIGVLENALGSDHPSVANILGNRARVLYAQVKDLSRAGSMSLGAAFVLVKLRLSAGTAPPLLNERSWGRKQSCPSLKCFSSVYWAINMKMHCMGLPGGRFSWLTSKPSSSKVASSSPDAGGKFVRICSEKAKFKRSWVCTDFDFTVDEGK